MGIDIKTFLELKLYEYITGRESFSRSILYSEFREAFSIWLLAKISKETATKYLRLLDKYVDEISAEAIKEAYEASTDKNNLSKAIRNLLNFLEDLNIIDPYQSAQIKKLIPINKGNEDIQVPGEDDILEAYSFYLSSLSPNLKLVSLILLYSGSRLRHILRMLREFNPQYLTLNGEIARYRITHLTEGPKKAFFIYMPSWLAGQLGKIDLAENYVRRKLRFRASSGKKVTPKYIRQWFNNFLVRQKVDKDIRNFIMGRVGEIKGSVEADRYLELTNLADAEYSRVLRSFPFDFSGGKPRTTAEKTEQPRKFSENRPENPGKLHGEEGY